MDTIPGKQLHQEQASKAALLAVLSERELGSCTADSTLYIRIGDQLLEAVPYLTAIAAAKREILEEIGSPLVWINDATVAYLNGTIPGLKNGWTYTLTDAGTLTAGNVQVEPGDEVAWSATGSKWVKIGGDAGKLMIFTGSVVQGSTTYPDGASVMRAIRSEKDVVIFFDVQGVMKFYRMCSVSGYSSLTSGSVEFYRYEDPNSRLVLTQNNDTYSWDEISVNSVVVPSSVANEYSSVSTYSTGNLVTYGGVLYQANQDISTPESWNPAHWSIVSVSSLLDLKLGYDELSGIIAPIYSTSGTYKYPDVVLYDRVLYRCTSSTNITGNWDSTKWTAIHAMDVFSGSAPGLVPTATANDASKALRGDGTWGDVSTVSVSYDAVNEQLHLDFSPQQQNNNP